MKFYFNITQRTHNFHFFLVDKSVKQKQGVTIKFIDRGLNIQIATKNCSSVRN